MSVPDGAQVPARLVPLLPVAAAAGSPFGGGRGLMACGDQYWFEAENAFLIGSRRAGLERLATFIGAGFRGPAMRELIEIARHYDPATDRLVGQIERAAAAAAVAAGDPSLLPGYAVHLDQTVVATYVTRRLHWQLPPELARVLSPG